ncbi:glycosyltransferase [Actinoplanes sp. NPDC051411]|uniref:glycosyltransferase n=1 Tax=Actinoplanes sp. NPDC051411 TaxID=3155522 RepID=UPI00343A1475
MLAAVTGVVISRALNPEGRGIYSVIVTIASTATVLGHLSIGQASVSFWSTDRSAIPTNSLILGPLLGAGSAVLTGAAILLVSPGAVPRSAWPLLFLALASVPVAVACVHLSTVVLLLGQMTAVNRSVTVSALLQCGALVALSLAGHPSPAAVIWVWVLSGAVPLLFFLPVLRPHLGRGDAGVARRMVGTGLRYQAGLVALNLLSRIDVLILNALVPGAPVGLYTLAVSVGEITHVATNALAQVVLADQAEASLDRATGLTVRSVRASVIMAAGVVSAACLAAPWLVPILYGNDFRGSVPAIFALAPGVLAISATRSVLPYLLRLDRPWLVSGTSFLALAVNVMLNLLLIPRWGIVGCALASSAGWLVLAGCQVTWFTRATGTSPAALLPGRDDLARARSEIAALRARRPAGEKSPGDTALRARARPAGLVSVVTPTYNRAHTLRDAFSGLLEQQAALEWIVVDDGSTDRTKALVEQLADRAPFPVRYLRQAHAGKHLAVNRGVAAARGELVALLDSDDALLPGALDRLLEHWVAIADPAGYVGVTGLDIDEAGQVIGARFPADVVDATWQEMRYRCRMTGDKWGVLRTDVLRDNPFRIAEGYIAEGEVWRRIGLRYRTRYVNVPVLSCRTSGADRITRLPYSAVAAGMVHYHILVLTEDIRWFRHHPTTFVRTAGNLVRGQFHLGVPVHRQPRPLTTWRARLLWATCLPCGWVLYRRDRVRHRPMAVDGPAGPAHSLAKEGSVS